MKLAALSGLIAVSLALAACSAAAPGPAAPTPAHPAAEAAEVQAPAAAGASRAPGSAALSAAPPIASALAAAAVPAAAPQPELASEACASNAAAQFVVVVISQQHAWMCAKTVLVYDTPVTTGEVANGNDTPTGTWHVQSKQGARYLTTRDGTRYHVDYWIPYDDIYGFHDAAWQTFPEGSELYRTQGSHGCVHLPLAAMAWLAGWIAVGATVTIRA